MKILSKIISLCLCCFLLLTTANINAFAGAFLRKKTHSKEEKAFIEKQISPENKDFLDKLSRAFTDLAKLNQNSLYIFQAITAKESNAGDTAIRLEKQARRSWAKIKCRKCPKNTLSSFFQTKLPNEAGLQKSLDRLIADYAKCSNIEKHLNLHFKNSPTTSAAYRFFKIRLEFFEKAHGKSIEDVFKNVINTCNELSKAAKAHQMNAMQNIILANISDFKDLDLILHDNILSPMESTNQTMTNELLLSGLELVARNFLLNDNFLKSLESKMQTIQQPRQAKLGDLAAISIDINLTKEIKVKDRVAIFFIVQNIGELAIGSSVAKITFPDGTVKTKSIPKLKPQKAYRFRLRYKLKARGKNVFKIAVNHDNKVSESDSSNNLTERSLILP